jgi:hypothetical protein
MDRFMENADPQKKTHAKLIQSELNACRDRVRLLLEGKVSDLSIACYRVAYLNHGLGWPLQLCPRKYEGVPRQA